MKRMSGFRGAVICGAVFMMALVTGSAFTAEEGQDEVQSRLAERRREAIERLQRGESDRAITIIQLLQDEAVELEATETDSGFTLALSSEDEEVTRRIKAAVKALLERRERVLTRREGAVREEGERAERRRERLGEMTEEDRERLRERLQQRREQFQDMSEEERARMREERRQRFEQMMEDADPETRERIRERMERMRERRDRREREESEE